MGGGGYGNTKSTRCSSMEIQQIQNSRFNTILTIQIKDLKPVL